MYKKKHHKCSEMLIYLLCYQTCISRALTWLPCSYWRMHHNWMWVSSIDKYISQTSNATHMYHLLDVCEVHGSFSLSRAPLKIFPVGVSTSGGQDLYLAFILLLVWNKRIDKLLQNIRYINPCVLNAPSENIRKLEGFLIFSGGRERVHWERMG